jgi:hypothetical protein
VCTSHLDMEPGRSADLESTAHLPTFICTLSCATK